MQITLANCSPFFKMGGEDPYEVLFVFPTGCNIMVDTAVRLLSLFNSPVVFCHFWFQCDTLRPYLTHPHVKGAMPDAASHRGSRSPGDCSCGRLPGPLRESVPVSTFSELFDGPDRPGQQKPDQHH